MPRPLNIQSSPSNSQITFIRQSIAHNIRIDGRNNLNKRKPVLQVDALPHLVGSSYAYYEYDHVEVYTGIKLKLEQHDEGQTCFSDRIVYEISSMGKLAEEEIEELTRMKSLIYNQYLAKVYAPNSSVCKFLEIQKAKKHHLSLHIDSFILGPVHLTNIQLIVHGIKSALLSMKANALKPTINQITEEEYIETTNDEKTIEQNLPKQGYDPINQSLEVIGLLTVENESNKGGQYQIVLDMGHEQFCSMDACVVVGVGDEKITYMESLRGVFGIQQMGKISRIVLSQK